MEHQMNGKDQAALTACIPQSLAGGIFIYKADEGETLLYASDYVIGFFGCASYEELADYVHHSFRGMVDLRDRELVEQNIRQQTASDVCQTSYARYRVIACDGTVRYAEHFSRKVTLPGVGEVYYVFIADYDRKYLTSDIDNMTGLPGNRRFLQYVRDLMESGQFLSGYCLVYFNVINFKLVNIRYGVAVGDDCLKGLATMIRETFPQGFLSRRRNDHFQLLTPEGSVRKSWKHFMNPSARSIASTSWKSRPASTIFLKIRSSTRLWPWIMPKSPASTSAMKWASPSWNIPRTCRS